jgi:hypothetical protein
MARRTSAPRSGAARLLANRPAGSRNSSPACAAVSGAGAPGEGCSCRKAGRLVGFGRRPVMLAADVTRWAAQGALAVALVLGGRASGCSPPRRSWSVPATRFGTLVVLAVPAVRSLTWQDSREP